MSKVKSDKKTVSEFSEKLKNLCEKYQVELVPNLSYPQFNSLPPELELCNILLVKNNAEFKITIRKIDRGGKNAK